MRSAATIALIATAGAIVSGSAVAQDGSSFDRYYGPHMMWWNGYGMAFGPLFIIIVLGLTIALAVLVARWLGGTPPATSPMPATRTPLDILKERFARGDIDKDEYAERRRVLGD